MTLQTPSLIAPSTPVIVHRSPWHSPVPYLFGGLAAMLSLIAFALLILACSYSKHSGERDNDGETDREAGTGDLKPENQKNEQPVVFEEKFLVIMAGEAKPTFLATPVSSRASSFGSCSCQSKSSENSSENSSEEDEKEKQGISDEVQVRIVGDQDTVDLGR